MTTAAPTRLVIVDDNDTYRAGMVRVADAHPGIDLVAEADSGAAALDVIARHRPDVALVDLRMPTVDGLEVCRQVPHISPPLSCMVVLLSAVVSSGVHEHALESGAAAFLSKDLPRREILGQLLTLAGRATAA